MIRPVKLSQIRELARQRQQTTEQPANIDLDRAYWHGPQPEAERRGGIRVFDDNMIISPEPEPPMVSHDPQMHAAISATEPMWNSPPYWSRPFELNFVGCAPTWEEDHLLGTYRVGDMVMMVIKGISCISISGLGLLDTFEVTLADPSPMVRFSEMVVDLGTADPSHQYLFQGDTKPLKVEYHIDRGRLLQVSIKPRGVLTAAGASNHFPGEILANCHFRVTLHGWFAPLRDNIDGGPRPTDYGHPASKVW